MKPGKRVPRGSMNPQRDAKICDLVMKGAPKKAVAAVFGISRTRVQQIVAAQTAAQDALS